MRWIICFSKEKRVVQSSTEYYKVLQRQRKNLAHLLLLIFGLVCIWMYIFPWFMFSNPEKWANICLHRSGHSTTFCFLQHLQREYLENIASTFLCKFLFNMSTCFQHVVLVLWNVVIREAVKYYIADILGPKTLFTLFHTFLALFWFVLWFLFGTY